MHAIAINYPSFKEFDMIFDSCRNAASVEIYSLTHIQVLAIFNMVLSIMIQGISIKNGQFFWNNLVIMLEIACDV